MIGIIANPSSGKDIRRLVAQGTVVDNMEKVNIVQRIMAVAYEAGLPNELYMMPECFGMAPKAMEALRRGFHMDIPLHPIPIKYGNDQNDSTQAGQLLKEMGASCIITLGGDGTNRAVAKGCGDVPLIPMSTGTNNVFPVLVEGTMAGMAAVVAERDKRRLFVKTRHCKKINVIKNGEIVDIALIDAVITDDDFIGSRALYNADAIKELLVTVAKPDCLGMSAIAGSVHTVEETDMKGLYVEMGEGKLDTWVPMAPGMMKLMHYKNFKEVPIGGIIDVKQKRGMVALDGEREVFFSEKDKLQLQLTDDGPYVIDIHATLKAASDGGFFNSGISDAPYSFRPI